MDLTVQIKSRAGDLGFELVGIAPARPVPDYDFFRWWLDQGFQGTMQYLLRGAEKRGDPEKILPGARSIICCGMNYYAGGSGVPISRYAQGDDYHRIVGEKLAALENFIREVAPSAAARSYVDTGAILERSYAVRAGLGWIGKNTCLLNDGLGSFFFIGEILTTLTLEYDRPVLDQCGSCTRCLDACPTQALVEPYVMDARRCISTLTIEYRGEFTEEQSRMMGDHLYGCDICQDVCPYNRDIPNTGERRFYPREAVLRLDPDHWREMTEADFSALRKGSAMERIRWKEWRRNLGAARKNRGD